MCYTDIKQLDNVNRVYFYKVVRRGNFSDLMSYYARTEIPLKQWSKASNVMNQGLHTKVDGFTGFSCFEFLKGMRSITFFSI